MPLSSMATVAPGRRPGGNRRPTETPKQPSGRRKSYGPPVRGYFTNAPLSDGTPGTAIVLENFWAFRDGPKPRGGTKHRVTIAADVEYLFPYVAGGVNTYFAADANNVYEFDDLTADGTTLTATITGQTNADYTALESQTDGGSFIHLVNGVDELQLYDGTSWQAVNGASSPHAITGVATTNLIHVFSHINRLWFIEENSMNGYYLPVNSISGAATKFSFAGVFKKGGTLLFGSSWSSDSGEGLDDRAVFVTNQGECAVYSGIDPASSSTWVLQGVYNIGEALGKNTHFRIGGDLIIGTKAGFIPLSSVIAKDPIQLKLDSITENITPDIERQVELAGSLEKWLVTKWDTRDAVMIAPPLTDGAQNVVYAINAESRGVGIFTGWTVNAMAVLGDFLHYGDTAGKVYQCEQGGTDDGSIFECRGCLAFDDMGSPGVFKTAKLMRATWKHSVPINPQVSVSSNYLPDFPTAPAVAALVTGTGATWDLADWDVEDWATSGEVNQFTSEWDGVQAHGENFGMQFQVTSGAPYTLDCQLARIDIIWDEGTPI